jgi:hypothetical protein
MKAHMTAAWLLGAFSAAAVCGVAAWRLRTPAPLPVENFELIDRSGSDPTPCISVARTLERAIASSSSSVRWTFFVTGSAETAYEPLLMPVHSSPVRQRLIDGKERAALQNAAFVKEVTEACKGMPVTDISPLYLGLKHVTAQARQRAGKALVHVYLISDLRETVEGSIMQALKEPGRIQGLPDPIDVRGIKEVQVCGYAQTIGQARPKARKARSAPRADPNADRLIEVWSALFSDPASVEFVPFCF